MIYETGSYTVRISDNTNSNYSTININTFNKIFEIDVNTGLIEKKDPVQLSIASSSYQYCFPIAINNNLALFNNINIIDVFCDDLCRRTINTVGRASYNYSAANTGVYVLFAGGTTGNNNGDRYSNLYDRVISIDENLIQSSITSLSARKYDISEASIDGYALFAWGYGASTNTSLKWINDLDVYNTSLTKTNITSTYMPDAYASALCISMDNYALFSTTNLYTNFTSASFYTCNTSFTQSTITYNQQFYPQAGCTFFNNRAIIAGGMVRNDNNNITSTATVYSIDKSLTLSILPSLTEKKDGMIPCANSDYCMVAGGVCRPKSNYTGDMPGSTIIDWYDKSFTKSIKNLSLTSETYRQLSVSINGYMFAGNGAFPFMGSPKYSDQLDVFKFS